MLYENNTYDQERALYGVLENCEMPENCRAALWYDKNIRIENCKMMGIKALRECEKVVFKNTTVNSPEFIWKVRGLEIDNVEILGSEYPFFEVRDAKIKNLKMKEKLLIMLQFVN